MVVRVAQGRRQVLLVRPSNGAHEWVLPKGHLEAGEAPQQTAVREVAEETGIEATVEQALESVAFRARGEDVTVAFFLMSSRGARPPAETRDVMWADLLIRESS